MVAGRFNCSEDKNCLLSIAPGTNSETKIHILNVESNLKTLSGAWLKLQVNISRIQPLIEGHLMGGFSVIRPNAKSSASKRIDAFPCSIPDARL